MNLIVEMMLNNMSDSFKEALKITVDNDGVLFSAVDNEFWFEIHSHPYSHTVKFLGYRQGCLAGVYYASEYNSSVLYLNRVSRMVLEDVLVKCQKERLKEHWVA